MAFGWLKRYHVMKSGGESGLRPMSEFSRIDPGFSVPDLQARVSNLAIQKMFGLSDGDMEPLKPYVTEPLLKELQQRGLKYKKESKMLNVIRPAVLRTEILGFQVAGEEARVHVRIQTRAVLYVTDQSGRVVDGDRNREVFESETWVFSRGIDQKTGHVSAVESSHCPACGSPVNAYSSARCPRCGALVPVERFGWKACQLY